MGGGIRMSTRLRPTILCRFGERSMSALDLGRRPPGCSHQPSALSHVELRRALARPKLDDAYVGEAARVERILVRDPLDLLAVVAERHDDAAVARDLAARHQEMPRRVILLQKLHVRGHVAIDLGEARRVVQFDDEHRYTINSGAGAEKRSLRWQALREPGRGRWAAVHGRPADAGRAPGAVAGAHRPAAAPAGRAECRGG